MAEPFARRASVYHVPRLKPEMALEPSSVQLSTRHRLTVPLLSISAVVERAAFAPCAGMPPE
jgi:hypothetical protein